jgi:hypothetical protein
MTAPNTHRPTNAKTIENFPILTFFERRCFRSDSRACSSRPRRRQFRESRKGELGRSLPTPASSPPRDMELAYAATLIVSSRDYLPCDVPPSPSSPLPQIPLPNPTRFQNISLSSKLHFSASRFRTSSCHRASCDSQPTFSLSRSARSWASSLLAFNKEVFKSEISEVALSWRSSEPASETFGICSSEDSFSTF